MAIRKFAAALVAGAVCFGAQSAVAQDKYTSFGTTQGWEVLQDNATKECVMLKDSNGVAVQLGLAANDPTKGYIGVFTNLEGELKNGKTKKIHLLLDNTDYEYKSVITEVTEGVRAGYYGAMMAIDNPQFVNDFANKEVLVVDVEGGNIFGFSLYGTKSAMNMWSECSGVKLNID
ncbi:hypothetical protein [Chachezhania sediminis]|uniref:hypothetical protein n=1 Tax=Chachezhania sediminis TaxID=2599291 RepID=UPI00131DC183|nr:hypothetical protein [Chachezhania sediminis]